MKAFIVFIIVLLIANLVLFALGKISVLVFWIVIGLGFVSSQMISLINKNKL